MRGDLFAKVLMIVTASAGVAELSSRHNGWAVMSLDGALTYFSAIIFRSEIASSKMRIAKVFSHHTCKAFIRQITKMNILKTC